MVALFNIMLSILNTEATIDKFNSSIVCSREFRQQECTVIYCLMILEKERVFHSFISRPQDLGF